MSSKLSNVLWGGRALVLFAIVNLYIAYIGEGGAKFHSALIYGVCTTLLSGCFIGLHLSIAHALPNASHKRIDFSGLGLYQSALYIALLTVCKYFHNMEHIRLLLVVGVLVGITFFLCFKARLSLYRKGIIDALILGATGVYFRTLSIAENPLGKHSDMLILIEKALNCWTSGGKPYRAYVMDQVPGHPYTLYLTYLPLKWLSYLPAYWFHIDLRYTNLLIEGAIYGGTCCLIFRFMSQDRLQKYLIALAFLHLYYLNGYFIRRIDTEVAIYGGILMLTFLFLFFNKSILTFCGLGLLLAVNQLSLLLIPFLSGFSLYRFGIRRTLLGLLSLFLIAGTLLIPFVLASPQAFKSGLWDHWQQLCTRPYRWAHQWIRNINFSLFFYQYGQQCRLKYVQLGIALLVFTVFLSGRYYRNFSTTWTFCALMTFLFLTFNIIVWTYLYQPVILLSVFSGVALLQPAK